MNKDNTVDINFTQEELTNLIDIVEEYSTRIKIESLEAEDKIKNSIKAKYALEMLIKANEGKYQKAKNMEFYLQNHNSFK